MSQDSKPTQLFVYGSLRRGERYHAKLRGARFLCDAHTEACYELVDLGPYPALLEHGSDCVAGEIYEIDTELLEALDAFEEAPEVYERKALKLRGAHAEGYVMSRARAGTARRITSGDWRKR